MRRRSLGADDGLAWAPSDGPLARLDFAKNRVLERLPDGLACDVILGSGAQTLSALGDGIRCQELVIDDTAVAVIPDGTRIERRLSARDCHPLEALPRGLRTGIVSLQNCLALERLPDDLSPVFLDLAGCSALKALPDDLAMRGGRLNICDCALVASLPRTPGSVAQLDVSGCQRLTEIPQSLEVTSWLDIGGSGITRRPDHLPDVRLRWRGVPIDDRIAFQPERLNVPEILAERNAEVRRVMLERFGFETFMSAARAEQLDADRDPGGERRLLRLALEDDEPLVCVSVACPSTGRRYFLRVPPTMTTCRQAIAWTAGFDDPDVYAPLVET